MTKKRGRIKNKGGFDNKLSKKGRILKRRLEELPPELVNEILSRLPITSLFQSRYVSRSWRNLINNPRFSVLHYTRSSQNPNPSSLIIEPTLAHDRSLYCVPDIDKLENPIKLVKPPLQSLLRNYKIVTSLHGFLFIAGTKVKKSLKFVICNPVTGDWTRLPYPPKLLDDDASVFSGFGYSPSTHQYKVIRIRTQNENSTIDILTLGSNSWRSIGPVRLEYPFRLGVRNCGVFLNGHIHWLAVDYGSTPVSFVIQAFNVEEETFQMISVPGSIKSHTRLGLGVFDGSLTVVGYSQEQKDDMQVWVMKNYGVHESWTIEFLLHDLDDRETIIPLGVLKNGCHLLGDDCSIFSCDFKHGTFEKIRLKGFPWWFKAFPHVGTLASLNDVLALDQL